MGNILSFCFDKRSGYASGKDLDDNEDNDALLDIENEGHKLRVDGDEVYSFPKPRKAQHKPQTDETQAEDEERKIESPVKNLDAVVDLVDFASQEESKKAEDQLERYAFTFEEGQQEGEDEEDRVFTECERLRSANDSEELKFTKRGIIDYIENIISQDEGDNKVWELKLDKENIRVYTKKQKNIEHPYIKTEITFNSAFAMYKIIDAIFKVEHRLKWDKQVLRMSEVQIEGGNKNCFVKNQVNKGVLNMYNKEFVDKQIRFSEMKTQRYYVFYSAIPDGIEPYDNERKELPPKTERATTLVGVQKMWRRPDDGKIVYQMIMQCDLRVSVSPKIVQMFLPNGMQQWLEQCNKYINEKYDEI